MIHQKLICQKLILQINQFFSRNVQSLPVLFQLNFKHSETYEPAKTTTTTTTTTATTTTRTTTKAETTTTTTTSTTTTTTT